MHKPPLKPRQKSCRHFTRREALYALGAAALIAPRTHAASGRCLLTTPSCVVTPREILGPYPAFANGIVTMNGLRRQQLASDPGGAQPPRSGVPLEMVFKVVDVNNGCAPLTGHDVYVWHCDADGYYSAYSTPGHLGVKDYRGSFFLRGVQRTDECGEVSFNTIFPGWYQGRYTHAHIVVALNDRQEAVAQMGLPEPLVTQVYSTASDYLKHGLNPVTLEGDMVFRGNRSELATASGTMQDGLQSQWILGIER